MTMMTEDHTEPDDNNQPAETSHEQTQATSAENPQTQHLQPETAQQGDAGDESAQSGSTDQTIANQSAKTKRDEEEEAQKDPETLVSVSAEEECAQMKAIIGTDPQLKDGDTWYLMSTTWWNQWKSYSDYQDENTSSTSSSIYNYNYSYNYNYQYGSSSSSSDTATTPGEKPGPINNVNLIEENNNEANPANRNYVNRYIVRKTLLENDHFIFLSEPAWKLIRSWYGGGPVLPRKVIKSGWKHNLIIEVREIQCKIVLSTKMSEEEHPASYSKSDTVGKLKAEQCARFNLDPSNVKVWDYHARNKTKDLDKSSLNETLDDSQIIDGQLVLLEQKNADGTWPEPEPTFTYRSYTSNFMSSYSSGGWGNRKEPTEPGLVGLSNLGNTCFMASAIQCLSNTVPLQKFFISDKYKTDINITNPLGMKGDLAEEYAKLSKEIWSGEYSVISPSGFKRKLENFAPQFAGYQQHDSQELLAFLLDGLHEDLNRVINKPYVENKESNGRPDEEVANEAWLGHLSRNKSVVVDWFQGQLKSTLICPECNKVSVTFDPFMFLSLPLSVAQAKLHRTIIVTLFQLDGSKKPVRFGVTVDVNSNILSLKQELCNLAGLEDPQSIVITDVYNHRFFKRFTDNEPVELIKDRDYIYAYEIALPHQLKKLREKEEETSEKGEKSEQQENSESTNPNRSQLTSSDASSTTTNSDDDEQLIYIPVLQRKEERDVYRHSFGYSSSYRGMSGRQKALFGIPFVLTIPRKITYRQLYEHLLSKIQLYLTHPYKEFLPREEEEDSNDNNNDNNNDAAAASSSSSAAESQEQQQQPSSASAPQTREVETQQQAASSSSSQEPQQAAGSSSASAPASSSSQIQRDDDDDDDDTTSSSSSSNEDDDDEAEGSENRYLFTIRPTDIHGSSDGHAFVDRGDEFIELEDRQDRQTCIVLDWSSQHFQNFYRESQERDLEIHQSARAGNDDESDETSGGTPLSACLDLFTMQEKLGPDDPWYCSGCKEFRQASKQFNLWKVPPILVIHLKRFSYRSRTFRDKLDTLVNFPTQGLDLSSHVKGPVDPNTPPIYDLFAVSNHYGGLSGGHYTAFAKNKKDSKWYKFDDSHVTATDEDKVKSSAAYVLFYQRRDTISQNLEAENEDKHSSDHGDDDDQDSSDDDDEKEANPDHQDVDQDPSVQHRSATSSSTATATSTNAHDDDDDEIEGKSGDEEDKEETSTVHH